jgi:hypothetical protein
VSAVAKLEIIRGATVYDVSDILDFALLGDDGFGMPPIERLTEQGPNQHGVTDRGFRLQPRTLNLKIMSLPVDLADFYTLRDLLLRIFKPSNAPLIVRRTIVGAGAGGADLVRCADCHTVDGGRFSSEDAKAMAQKDVLQVYAPDPALYDPTGEALTFGSAGGGSGFTVPTPVPTSVGASDLGDTVVINYPGSWLTYPKIRITGPITNPVITNLTTGLKLDFTGITIADGAWYEIDCAYDKKTVLNNAGVNKIGDLTDDSDLTDFSIEADPEATGGTNSIQATGSAVNANTKIDLTWFVRYLGM